MSGADKTPRGIATKGVGSIGNVDHLNRTVTMADIWRRDATKPEFIRVPAKMGRPAGPLETSKLPYAGKDGNGSHEEWERT